MPYRPHSEYRSPFDLPQRGQKKRPSVAWFVVGGVLMAAAVAVFAIGVAGFARTVTHTDAVFRAAGTHAITLPAGTERGLFVPEGRPIPACQVTDGSGAALHFRAPEERFTYGTWIAVRIFETGDGRLVFSCPLGAGGRIRVAEVPSGEDFARFGFLGVLIPLGLGGLGFVVVLVTGILFYTRRPQPVGVGYGAPGGPPYGAAPGYPPGYPPAYPPTYLGAYPPGTPSATPPDADAPVTTPPEGPPEGPPGAPPPPG